MNNTTIEHKPILTTNEVDDLLLIVQRAENAIEIVNQFVLDESCCDGIGKDDDARAVVFYQRAPMFQSLVEYARNDLRAVCTRLEAAISA